MKTIAVQKRNQNFTTEQDRIQTCPAQQTILQLGVKLVQISSGNAKQIEQLGHSDL